MLCSVCMWDNIKRTSSALQRTIRGREAVLGGRHYWEGGGIGRKAVLGGRRYCEGGGIGRDDCISEEGDPQLRALS